MTGVMVGRDHLRLRLRDLLGSAAGSPGRLVWVAGEAGIGKTRLLAQADAIARDLGLGVLRGAGWSDPATPAFWVWTEVVRQAAEAEGGRGWGARARPGGGAGARARRRRCPQRRPHHRPVPALRRGPRRARRRGPRPAARGAARLPPLADAESLQLLAFLAASGLPDGVVVVAAWRSEETAPGDPADDVRVALERAAEVLTLTGLGADDLGDLVAETSGLRLTAADARTLAERTGGNPLFASEAGRLAAARGEGGSVVRLVPNSARALLRRRLARLTQPCAATLAAAAVAGATPPLRTVAAVSGQPLDVVADHLEEAETAGLATLEDGVVASATRWCATPSSRPVGRAPAGAPRRGVRPPRGPGRGGAVGARRGRPPRARGPAAG